MAGISMFWQWKPIKNPPVCHQSRRATQPVFIVVLPVCSQESSRIPMGRGVKPFIHVIHTFFTGNPSRKNGVLVGFFQNFARFLVFVGYLVDDIRKVIPRHSR
jgi:hypothetical protein